MDALTKPDLPTPPPICPVCGSTDAQPLCVVHGYEIHRCVESATDFVWPMPSADTLKALYDRPTYFEGSEFEGYQSNDAQTAHSLPGVMKLLERFPNGGEGLLILDVGCAYGTHLRLAADKHWKCFGIETSAHARRIAAERHGNRLTIVERVDDLGPQRFDLILMLDIIEHLPNPFPLFFSLFSKGAIGPETLVVIATPNAHSLDAVANPSCLTYRHPPSHLVYYSAKSLQLLLQRLRFKEIRIAGAHPLLSQVIAPYDKEATSLNDDLRGWGGIVCEGRGSDFASFMQERYVPGTFGSLAAYEHLPRYVLARTLAKGICVLDFGCGTGYGAALLAEVAQSVVGVDIDAGAIEWSRTTHRSPNLHFEQRADLGRGLAPGSFDLVTCFEVIEHVNHETQLELVRCMKDLLAPTGKLIISTPNPQITAHYGNNPYHLREMTAAQLMELLQPFFKRIVMFGQSVSPGVLIGPQPFGDGKTASMSAITGNLGVEIPVAYIALCSQEPFEPPAPLCQFDTSNDFAFQTIEAERRLNQLRFENYALKERLTGLDSLIEHTKTELAALRNSRMLRLGQVIRNEPLSVKKLVRISYLLGSIVLPLAAKHRILSLAPWLRLRFGGPGPAIAQAKPYDARLAAQTGSNRPPATAQFPIETLADKDRSLYAEAIGGCDPSSNQNAASPEQSSARTDVEAQAGAGDRPLGCRRGLKVALFVHCFFPKHFYGTETYTLQIADHLRRMGHKPVVVSAVFEGKPEQDQLVTRYFYDGIPVYCIDRNFAPHSCFKETYYQENLRGVLRDLLEEIRPDLVHVTHLANHTAVLLEVINELGLPAVATMTDFFGLCLNSWLKAADGSQCPGPNADRTNCLACYLKASGGGLGGLAAKWPRLTTWGLSAALRVPGLRTSPIARLEQDIKMRPDILAGCYAKYRAAITPTRFLREAYIANGLSTRCFDISFGVDLPRMPKPARPNGQPLAFGFVGQIASHKGTDLLVDAFARLPHGAATLQIYGPEDQAPGFMANLRRASKGHLVRFEGTFPSQRMAGILRDLDILVIPSRWCENSPLVLLNALATHTPVIVSDTAGLTEFVEEGRSGFKFAIGSAAALEQAMRRFVEDSQLAARLSGSTEYPRTTRAMVEDTLNVYAFVLG
jgi:2-polyprenyl-3-methyl-5-hydroxy-6-metoxy-1,4-benzoquinol methylase/glycosyltransferase involved in cell wall biosynthesis